MTDLVIREDWTPAPALPSAWDALLHRLEVRRRLARRRRRLSRLSGHPEFGNPAEMGGADRFVAAFVQSRVGLR